MAALSSRCGIRRRWGVPRLMACACACRAPPSRRRTPSDCRPPRRGWGASPGSNRYSNLAGDPAIPDASRWPAAMGYPPPIASWPHAAALSRLLAFRQTAGDSGLLCAPNGGGSSLALYNALTPFGACATFRLFPSQRPSYRSARNQFGSKISCIGRASRACGACRMTLDTRSRLRRDPRTYTDHDKSAPEKCRAWVGT